jgi:PAS domain S-box-containing protein
LKISDKKNTTLLAETQTELSTYMGRRPELNSINLKLPYFMAKRYKEKTKDELIAEVASLRRRIDELESDEADHRITEEALRNSEESFRRLSDAAFEGIVIHDRGIILEVNNSLQRMLGYEPSEAIGKHVLDFTAPDSKDIVIKTLSSELENPYEATLLKKDGTPIFCELCGKTILYKGRIVRVTAIRDISERRRAEISIRESEAKLRKLVEADIFGVMFADILGNVLDANDAFLKIVGYTREDLVSGKLNWIEMTPAEHRILNDIGIEQAAATGKCMLFEREFFRKDGSRVPILIGGVPLDPELKSWIVVVLDLTERKQIEEALRISQQRYENLVNSIDSIVWEADPESFQFTFVSKRAERLFGYAIEEWLKPNFWADHIHPEDREWAIEFCKNATLKNMDHVFEYRMIAADGRAVWLRELVSINTKRDQKLIRGVMVDITERKIAEEALKKTELRLRTVVANSPIVLFAIDRDGIITLSEGRGLDLLGIKTNDTVGQSVFTIYNDITEIVSQVRRALSGETFTDVALFRGFYFEIHYSPLRDENGQISGTIGVAFDVTERKRAEEALAAEKERLSVTLRSIGDGVIATDASGQVVLVSEAAERMIGWTLEEAEGKPLSEVFHIIDEKTGVRREDPVEKVLKTGYFTGMGNNTLLISRDGTERVIADSGTPIRNRSGEVIGVVLVFRDITEKRKIESEMLKASKLESVGLLAGGIAHDFNNILTAIIGNLSLAKMAVQPKDDLYQRLTDIEKASLLAKNLTQQLLTFSKGGAPIVQVASIGDLLRESALFALRGSNVECEFSIPEDLWKVEIDEGQINQVISNMIINSLQAMPNGGLIRIVAENVEIGFIDSLPLVPGKYVKIILKDEGIGIPRENFQKIFDPYFTTKPGGSGLGLATSYSIIKKHNGHITVESDLGTGTTFYIYLPATYKKMRQRVISKERELSGKGKILVMDDKEILREIVCEMLNRLGYKSGSARDGVEAVELYKSAIESGDPYDAIILDLTVPGGMSGREAIKELLMIDPKVKAIVSSGYSNDPVMADYRGYGFSGIIVKPFKIDDLRDALEGVLEE